MMPKRTVDPKEVEQTLENVLRRLSGYEHRSQQIDMALAVTESVNSGNHLMVEAGTGCGKTMAYLIPLLLSGKRFVVSTYTLGLQSQLAEKDLLFLQGVFPRPFRFAVAKGRGNYVCVPKMREAERFLLHDSPDLETLRLIRKEWEGGKWNGDVSKLEFNVNMRFWIEELASQTDECHSSRCDSFDKCGFRKARRACEEADVIVANHALYLSDLITGGAVLPHHDLVVFDEGHHLEQVATGAFAVEIPRWGTRNLLVKIERRAPSIPPRVRHNLIKADDRLLEWVEKRRWRDQLLREEEDLPVLAAEYNLALSELSTWLKELELDEIQLFADSAEGAKTQAKAYQDIMMMQVLGLRERWIHFEQFPTEEEGFVTWLQADRGRDLFTLQSAPLSVSETLAERLWSEKQSILTSATLAVNGSFDFIRSRLGLPEAKPADADARAVFAGGAASRNGSDDSLEETEPYRERWTGELIVGSPFDFTQQALLFFPRGLPDPRRPDFNEALCPVIEELLGQTQGRAFVLFTSYRSLREVADILRPRLPFPCRTQEEMPRPALLEWFKTTPNAVLFATSSFWEGVDVPGQALSCVIIDKMPFARPDDPVVQATTDALKREGRDWFSEYSLPKAILLLKQGFGRLIRTRTDRGVVALCDPRLLVKPYGKTVVWSLPPARRIFRLDRGDVVNLLSDNHETDAGMILPTAAIAAEPTTDARS